MTARALACLLALGTLAASACGAPRGGAVAETGPCAQVVPLARQHVGSTALLVHARALKRSDLRQVMQVLGVKLPAAPSAPRRPPRGRRAAPSARPRGQSLPRVSCLLIYRGGGSKRYRVLVIRVRHPRLLADVETSQIPRAIARRD